MMEVEMSGSAVAPKLKVCHRWRAGYCNRHPCPYLHVEPAGNGSTDRCGSGFRRNLNSWVRQEQPEQGSAKGGVLKKPEEKLCRYWLQGNCRYGDKCKFLHSWHRGESFSLLSQLEGHEKVVTGIALPSGSDKLYTGSKDGTLRVWDCNSGQSAGVIDLGGEIGCVVSEGQWIFVGLKNLVRAWNSLTNTNLILDGPVGQVYAIVAHNNMLFAGAEDGSILVWKFDVSRDSFEPAASLKGHTGAVVTLIVGANRLYSGSVDHTIRMWNLENLECMQTLTDHTDVVMSVLCCDQVLLSCSLDKTVKVWACPESGHWEVTYTHNEEHGLLKLHGMHDAEKKPVLLCSCNDNSVRIYDLPSFAERGKIFSKMEWVRAIQDCPGGIFLTGDGTGPVRVWKWEG